mgnify:CR=1 FL=1
MFPTQHGRAWRRWTLKLWGLSRKSGDLESSGGMVVREVFLEEVSFKSQVGVSHSEKRESLFIN